MFPAYSIKMQKIMFGHVCVLIGQTYLTENFIHDYGYQMIFK